MKDFTLHKQNHYIFQTYERRNQGPFKYLRIEQDSSEIKLIGWVQQYWSHSINQDNSWKSVIMGKKIQYIHLPIYSIATYLNIMYFSGGGGGSTGIPNQIFVFEGRQMKEPKNRILTGDKIYQNLTVSVKFQKLVCSAGRNILIFKILEKGKKIQQQNMFEADFSLKNATINSICFHPQELLFVAGGDDCFTRFYRLDQSGKHQLYWEHDDHKYPVRTLQSNSNSLFISTDMEQVIVSNYKAKCHVRRIYIDQLNPSGCMFQAAYFQPLKNNSDGDKQFPKLFYCHYIPRKQTFVSKQTDSGKIITLQISKDQSCLTSAEGKYVGVACGKGTTYVVDTEQMKILNQKKGHEFVVTAAILTKGRRFITGTPECSYVIQESTEEDNTWISKIILFLFFLMALVLKPGSMGEQL